MFSEKNAPLLLGAAFLLVIVTSLTNGLLFRSAVGTGGMSDVLLNISAHVPLMRLSILAEMLNSSSVILLAALLYRVLNRQNQMLALIALGWWLGEALSLGLTSAGASALIPLSLDFVKAGAPSSSLYQTLGEFLYQGVHQYGYGQVHMWFYCLGGMLWYSLFYHSRYIPRPISFCGVIAALLAFAAVLLQYAGYDAPLWMSIPLLPFELSIGFWLLLKGIREDSAASSTRSALSVGGHV